MYKKVIRLKLDPQKHEKFRRWAFESRTTMQAELEDHVSELVESVMGVGAPVVPRAISAPKTVHSVSVVSPGEPDIKMTKPCSVCTKECDKWVYGRKNEIICMECAERLSESNP